MYIPDDDCKDLLTRFFPLNLILLVSTHYQELLCTQYNADLVIDSENCQIFF